MTASELAAAAAELAAALAGTTVLDVVPLAMHDDLLLVLTAADGGGKRFLHVALGSPRARVTLTARRFARHHRLDGPRTQGLQQLLVGATFAALEQPPGERRLALQFAAAGEKLWLHVELFSARGLWALCASDGTVRELSRPVATAVRTLRSGDRYAPPPPRASSGENHEPPSRFALPVLASIDAHYSAEDERAERDAERDALQLACDRARQRAEKKAAGLREQLAQSERAPALRAEADLMLAYLHTVARGALSMTVPDPTNDGATIAIELDPALPVRLQAQARYERARRLDEGRAITAQRLQTAELELASLRAAAARLAAAAEPDIAAVRAEFAAIGVRPAPPAGTQPPPKPKATKNKTKAAAENVRRFTSIEGYEILVGRDNQQNDRLTLRIANGNDVWLHVGSGRPGSHVVVRLPKNKSASLDTLLDAGHLAVHFSKARGERIVDVVYTFAKHVRKPKGLPAGAVVPSHTKSLTVRLAESRLQRLLASQPNASDPD